MIIRSKSPCYGEGEAKETHMVVKRFGLRLTTRIREATAVATAELRSRRLIRTWLVLSLAVAVVFGSHALIALEHIRDRGGGVLVDVYTPRFAISWLGAVWLWLFLIAAVFLGFDTRLRDVRERVTDVLDADRRRDDGSFACRMGFGVGLLLLGATGIGTVVMDGVSELRQRDRWLAVHEAADPGGLADVERIAGTVRIDPGNTLALDLELRVKAPVESQDRLVFSLNPGLAVTGVAMGSADLPFSHEDGLLKVDLAGVAPGGPELVLGMQAAGVPDGRFAYLDSAVDWRRLSSANPLLLLGTDAAIFESAYVALPLQAAEGWNKLGEFELDPGEVSVVVSDRADGQVLVADAIRWTPVDP